MNCSNLEAHRVQRTPFLESRGDYVSYSNLAHRVDVFVGELDLVNFGFDGAIPADTGATSPRMIKHLSSSEARYAESNLIVMTCLCNAVLVLFRSQKFQSAQST